MNPHNLVGLVGPVNNFAVGGMPMHLTQILLQGGHTLPLHLFMDVLTEKTQPYKNSLGYNMWASA